MHRDVHADEDFHPQNSAVVIRSGTSRKEVSDKTSFVLGLTQLLQNSQVPEITELRKSFIGKTCAILVAKGNR
jgi:hypothetical protein